MYSSRLQRFDGIVTLHSDPNVYPLTIKNNNNDNPTYFTTAATSSITVPQSLAVDFPDGFWIIASMEVRGKVEIRTDSQRLWTEMHIWEEWMSTPGFTRDHHVMSDCTNNEVVSVGSWPIYFRHLSVKKVRQNALMPGETDTLNWKIGINYMGEGTPGGLDSASNFTMRTVLSPIPINA